jgi:hypothetical protein
MAAIPPLKEVLRDNNRHGDLTLMYEVVAILTILILGFLLIWNT